MGHLDRGDMPNLDIDSSQNQLDGGYFYYGRYYVYDTKFFLMQIFADAILLIIAFFVFVFSYESSIIDPIEGVKSAYINIHMISLVIIGGACILSVLLSKSKEKLVTRLIIILAISFIALSAFAIARINLDGTYTKDWFEKAYENAAANAQNGKDMFLSLDNLSVEFKDARQYFVDECIKLYGIFQVKSFGLFIINLGLTAVMLIIIFHTIKSNEQQKKVDKDVLILCDEEINMRQ